MKSKFFESEKYFQEFSDRKISRFFENFQNVSEKIRNFRTKKMKLAETSKNERSVLDFFPSGIFREKNTANGDRESAHPARAANAVSTLCGR